MAYYRRSYKKRAATRSYRKRTYKRRVYKRRYVRKSAPYRRRSYYKKPRSKVLGASALKCYRRLGDAPKCQMLEARAVVGHQRKALSYDRKKPAAIASGTRKVEIQLSRLQTALGAGGDIVMGEGLKRPREANAPFNDSS